MDSIEKQLFRKTDELFKKLEELGLENVLLTTLGNSISTGLSYNDVNAPLLDRNEFFDIVSTLYGINLEKHKFSRSENNSDEQTFQYIINNVSENEIDALNNRDYTKYLNEGRKLLSREEITELYPGTNKTKIQDVLFKEEKKTGNIVIYNGGTGSLLENWIWGGKHHFTGGIKKDVSYIETIMGLIQNNNRKTEAHTQVYLCGAPRIFNTDLTDIFINGKLKAVASRYANTSYVQNFFRQALYKCDGRLMVDAHYSKDEYLTLLYLILDSIICNYQFVDYLIQIDRKLYNLNRELEMSMQKRNTSVEVLNIINYYANLTGEHKQEFLTMCKKYLLERYPHDYNLLDRNAIKNQVKILK